MTGLYYGYIGRYERGQSRPSAVAAQKLADALGVTTEFLIEGSRDEAAKTRFSDCELLRQFQEVQQLGDDDKQVIKTLLEALWISLSAANTGSSSYPRGEGELYLVLGRAAVIEARM